MKDDSQATSVAIAILLAILSVSLAPAAPGPGTRRDLTEATLEDLMNIDVTTVSRKQQALLQSAAAIFVITQEDIRRSGMNNIADLMRMVPGMQVGQIQGGPWAVSARGFNDHYSNKLLVLVDGRSVYSPTHAGVNWEERDTLFEDIERIEVIRGPGATLWGANAVNGVINIITKTAQDTQGALVTSGIGDRGQALGGVRFGGQLGKSGHYRAFAKYLQGRGLSNTQGRTLDGERSVMGGFRGDWTLSSRDSLTMEADALRGHANSEVTSFDLRPPFRIARAGVERNQAGDFMLAWTRRQSDRSSTTLRASFDHSSTEEPNLSRGYNNTDVDFQHQLALSESNDLVWGLGFRNSATHGAYTFSASFARPRRNDTLCSGFVQDQLTLADGHVAFILGSKFERNSFTGVEIQPDLRFLWTPDNRQALWASVSRAVRTPATINQDLRVNVVVPGPGGAPLVIGVFGDKAVRSEELLAFDLGYRLQANRRLSIDLATFHNIYHRLATSEPGTPYFEQDPKPPHLVLPTYFGNRMHGQTNGLEIASTWNIASRWRLMPGYSWLAMDMRRDPDGRDPEAESVEGKSPRHQFQVRSNLDVSRRLQFDSAIYYTGALPALLVPAYTRLDARVGYRLRPGLELSLAGQNLQGGRHAEFLSVGPYTQATISRSLFAKLARTH